jgi:ATP-dependent DNA helicase RecG
VRYCVALANEGGGQIILAVTDQLPRRVVGSQTFADLERTKAGLIERLRLRVEAEEVHHPDGRVLVFHVPARSLGMPIQYEGAYWIRVGKIW